MTSEWKPIESAPKDGSCILIVNVEHSIPMYNVVFWDADQKGAHRWGMVEGGYYANKYPHYWMPLPLPPKPQEDG